MARPLKYEDPLRMEELIAGYFGECADKDEVPNKAGLALYLELTREGLNGYEKREEFADTIKRAYSYIEDAWLQLLAKGGGAGPIFYLKAAFQYKDKQDVDVTSGGKPLSISFDTSFNDRQAPPETTTDS